MFNIIDYDALYAILGLSPGASESEIKTAHRGLVKRNHSDKITDTRKKKAADERLAEINNAKDELLKYWKSYQCAPPRTSRASQQAHEHSAYHAGAHAHTNGPNQRRPDQHEFRNAGQQHGASGHDHHWQGQAHYQQGPSFNDPWEEFEQKIKGYNLAQQLELIRQFILLAGEALNAKRQKENAEAQAQRARWNAWDRLQKEKQKKAQKEKREAKLIAWARIILIIGVIGAIIAAASHPQKKTPPSPLVSNIYQATEPKKVDAASPSHEYRPVDEAQQTVTPSPVPLVTAPTTSTERDKSPLTPAMPKSKTKGKHRH